MGVEVHLHTEHRVGVVDERLFSGFLEHLGRAVYGGIYDPASPLSDGRGFRVDVIEALGRLRLPLVRYPGGNFVSAYDWRDGVGPREARPRRPESAWRSVETNQFGTDEFVEWCAAVGSAPMLAVNLGTGSPAEAAALVEYCNLPAGTSNADLRVVNGHADPYGVTVWCLGNEMDGSWQAGHVPAATYAERALVASSLMKGIDPSIETVACGSSGRDMATYLEWDRTVLEHCWDKIDLLSVHRYSGNRSDDTASFLADGVVVDEMLNDYRGLLAVTKARLRSRHDVRLCFDEWNVWYRETGGDGGWSEAPPLLEERYNFEDALVCAQYLHAFLRNADIVSIACIAQLVNVIAPVLTRADAVLLQSTYWPLLVLRDAAVGESLHVVVRGPDIATALGDVPAVDAAATFDETTGTGCVSIVNRSTTDVAEVAVRVADRHVAATTATLLHASPKAPNDWDTPDVIAPTDILVTTDDDGALRLTVPAPAHAVIRFQVTH